MYMYSSYNYVAPSPPTLETAAEPARYMHKLIESCQIHICIYIHVHINIYTHMSTESYDIHIYI